MDDRQLQLGPTGEAVAANVKRLREEQRLTFAELSRQLEQLGRPIATLGLRRIEAHQRRVDADDLSALASALRVTPATLLMPPAQEEFAPTSVTGFEAPLPAYAAWDWLTASADAEVSGQVDERGRLHADAAALRDWELWILPPFLRQQQTAHHPARGSLLRLNHFVTLALAPSDDAGRVMGKEQYRDWLLVNLRREARTVLELADDLEAGRVWPEGERRGDR